MSASRRSLQFILSLIDRVSGPISRIQQRIGGLLSLGAKVGGVLSGVGISAGLASATKITAGYEDMQASLEGVSASSTEAGKALDAKNNFEFIRQFASKAPAFGIHDTATAFLQLKGAGIDPMLGGLKSLGDAASALNKPFDAASQMITDSIMGENERLKEFLVTAQKNTKEGIITYNYMNKLGQQMQKTARIGDQAGIANTIFSIMDDKYGGASAKKAETFNGKLSNLKDTLAGLQARFMGAGLFDVMKNSLQSKIDLLTQLSESGAVERWGARAARGAELVGYGIDTIINSVSTANAKMDEFVGGWSNLGRIFGLVKTPATLNNGLVPEWLKPKQLGSGAMSPLLDQTHHVNKGDNLWNLAKQYKGQGTQYTQLAELNALANPDRLSVGQQVTIAKAKTSVLPAWAKPSLQTVDNVSPTSPLPQAQPTALADIAELAKSNKLLASAVLIREAYETTSTKVAQSLEKISTAAKTNFGTALDWGLAHSEQLSQASKIASSLVISYFSRIPSLVGMAYRSGANFSSYLLSTANNDLPAFKQQVSSLFKAVGNWAEANANKIKAAFSPAINALLQKANSYLSKLNIAAESGQLELWLNNLLRKVQPATIAIIEFGAGIGSALKTVGDFIIRISEFVGGWGNLGKVVAALAIVTVLGSTLAALAALLQIIFITEQIMWATGAVLMLIARSAMVATAATWLYQKALVALRAIALVIRLAAIVTSFVLWAVAAGTATAATWLFNAALAVLTSPITLVIAAIAALAAGAYYLYTHWAQVKAYLGDTTWGQALLGIINAVIHPLDTFNAAVGWLEGKWTSTKASLAETTWGQMILGAINALFSPFETFKASIAAAQLVWEGIKSSLRDTSWGQAIIGAIDKIMGLIGKFKEAWSFVKNAASDIGSGALDKIKGAGSWVSSKLGFGSDETPTAKFGGGRALGGTVLPGHFYRVNEQGPELLQTHGQTFLITGGAEGNIIPFPLMHERMSSSNQTTILSDRLSEARERNSTRSLQREAKVLDLRKVMARANNTGNNQNRNAPAGKNISIGEVHIHTHELDAHDFQAQLEMMG